MRTENREATDDTLYLNENGRVHRYLFPELREQAVLVGNYAYDQVNKALQLCIGVETEIWGLRKTCAEACPELADYIGEVNRYRRKRPGLLMHGTFRDTVGARVKGDVFYSVLLADNGDRAIVLRNRSADHQKVVAKFNRKRPGSRCTLWRPFGRERKVTLPADIVVRPHEAVVIIEHWR